MIHTRYMIIAMIASLVCGNMHAQEGMLSMSNEKKAYYAAHIFADAIMRMLPLAAISASELLLERNYGHRNYRYSSEYQVVNAINLYALPLLVGALSYKLPHIVDRYILGNNKKHDSIVYNFGSFCARYIAPYPLGTVLTSWLNDRDEQEVGQEAPK